jgi:hypothetical protein
LGGVGGEGHAELPGFLGMRDHRVRVVRADQHELDAVRLDDRG